MCDDHSATWHFYWVNGGICENFNKACHIKYVVSPFKIKIDLQKYILDKKKHDNEMQDYEKTYVLV